MRTISGNLDTAPDSQLVSIKTTCDYVDASRATIYRLNKAGKLPFHKIGKLTRLALGDVRRLKGQPK